MKTSVRAYGAPVSVVPFVVIVSVRFRFDSFSVAVSVAVPLTLPVRSTVVASTRFKATVSRAEFEMG